MPQRLDTPFKTGLRASESAPRGAQGLLVAHNVRVAPEGILAPRSITLTEGLVAGMAAASPVISGASTYASRFFVFRSRLVCCTATDVYYVTFTAPDTWTFTNVKTAPGLEWSYILGENLPADYAFEAIASAWSYTPGEFTQVAGGGANHEPTASPCTIQHTGLTIPAGTYVVTVKGYGQVKLPTASTVKAFINASGTTHNVTSANFTFTDEVTVGASSSLGVTVDASFDGVITELWVYKKASTVALAGGQWHASDFGEVQILHSPNTSVILTSGKAYLDNRVKAGTGCNFRGRLLLADFSNTSIRPELIAYWTALGETPLQFNASTVWWSTLGLGDPMQFFDPDTVLAHAGSYEELLMSGMQGWHEMPAYGKVHALKAMNSCVMAYCANAVVQLLPSDTGAFGVRKVLDVGVGGRDCVAGSAVEHLMVATTGEVYRLRDNSPLSIENLDYREWFRAQTFSTLTVQHNPLNGEYVIHPASADVNYLLTPSGLSTVNDRLLGAFCLNGLTYNVNPYTDFELATDPKVVIETEELDFGSRGVKTLTDMLVGLKSATPSNIRLSVKYAYNDTALVHQILPATVMAGGRVLVGVSGVTFKFCIEADAPTDLERLEYLQFEIAEGGRTRLESLLLGGT